MRSIAVVVTAGAADLIDVCLAAPGLRDLRDRVPIVVVGDASLRAAAEAGGVRFVPVSRPDRATARNVGLASVATEMVAFVDGRSRPASGWLDHLADAAGRDAVAWHPALLAGRPDAGPGPAAVLGRARCGRDWATTRTVSLDGRTGPPASTFGGGLFERRALVEVGGFSPLVRQWDDLYITARLLGYGRTVSYAPDAVVDAEPDGGRTAAAVASVVSGFWLEDLHRAADRHARALRCLRRPAVSPRSATLAAGRLGRLLRPPLPRRRPLVVHSRFPVTRPGLVHLTIDDAPSANTPALLRILRRHGAVATFFVIGEAARAHPDELRDIAREGHGIGEHSLTHRRFDTLNHVEMGIELESTHRLLAAFSRPGPVRIRLPFGAGVDDSYVHEAVRRWRSDCEIVHWSHDTEDHKYWPGCRSMSDTERLAGTAAERILASDDLAGSVVLMHDTAYGGSQPYPDRFAQVLLDRLLTGLAERDLRTAPLPETVVPGKR